MTTKAKKPKKILVIDDDASVRDFIRSTLERSGYTVTVCCNGKEGADAFKKGNYALVITDMAMPVSDGIDAIVHIRRMNPAVPIIAMSGVDRSKSFLKLADFFTADIMLPKPFSAKQLLAIVNKCFGN